MEHMNQIVYDLVQTKHELGLANEKIHQLVYQHKVEMFQLQTKWINIQKQLENQIESQEQTIRELNEEIRKSLTENHYLKERNNYLSDSLYNHLTTIETTQTVRETKTEPHLNGICEDPTTVELALKAEEQRRKTKTIVMKLKQLQTSESSPQIVDEPVNGSSLDLVPSDDSPLDLRFFVGRLSAQTNEKMLKEYFSQFGSLADIFMPREGIAHRGYAFITFSKLFDDKPLKISGHVIDNKRVHIDISCAKDDGKPTETLLISGLIRSSSDSTLKQHFEKFGEIVCLARFKEVDGKYSRYAFIHYKQPESVDRVLSHNNHVIDGFRVDCRRAHGFSVEGKKIKQSKDNPSSSGNVSKHVAHVSKLMVSNLTKKTTFKMLKSYFSKYGTVLDAYVPTVYGSGESKGFGYVVMKDPSFDFRGHVIDGSRVNVSHDNEFHSKVVPTSTVLVSAGPSIIAKIPEQEFRKFFAQFGRVVSVRKFTDPLTKKHSHYAFVEFTSTSAVDKVLENIGYYISGQLVTVTRSRFPPHLQ